MMRTEQITYLNTINHYASLHKASEALHISTQALSLSMRTLEKELGFSILIRTRSGVTLTAEGKQLLDIGNQFLRNLKQIQDKNDLRTSSLTGSLKIMATNGVVETLLPPLISQLLSDYPKFRVKPVVREFNKIIESLNQEKIELAFIYKLSIDNYTITPYDNHQFSFQSLLSGTYYCAIPESHPASKYKTISLKSLVNYPVIVFTPTSNVILKLFDNISKPEIIFADSFTIYKQLLRDGIGLGLTFVLNNSEIPVPSLSNIKYIPFKEHITSELGFLYKNNSTLSQSAQNFIEYLTCFLDTNPLSILSIS